MSEILTGRKIGHYELREMIGKGGMAVVYRAAQPRIDREVAIKIIAAPYAQHPAFVRRFEQEMRAAVRLQHPHILPVYDVSLEGQELYMVMAYLPGGTLSRRIAASPGGLSIPDAVCIISQVAAALDYAHAQRIVHRDVKPANIMLDGRGNAYLGDFGIARLADDEHLPALGTFAYMAPELLAGRQATRASDIYSLGVVAFEMLAGRRPFEAHDRAALLALRAQVGIPDIRPLRPDLPPGIQVVLAQALAEDPDGRPPHASSLAQTLHRASGLTGLPCAGLVERRVEPVDVDELDELDELDVFDEFDELVKPLAPAADDYPDEDDFGLDEDLDAVELADHELARTPPPFADLGWMPDGPETEPDHPVEVLTHEPAPPTQVHTPTVPHVPTGQGRASFGSALLLIWIGLVIALLAVAVLAVIVISGSAP